MLDLFGSKKKTYLASPIFQRELTYAKDFKALLREMSSSRRPILTQIAHPSRTGFCIRFSTTIDNDDLRRALNSYYDFFYGSSMRVNDKELDGLKKHFLDDIQKKLFPTSQAMSLYKKHENASFNFDSLISEGFSLPEWMGSSYSHPDWGEDIPFSYFLGFDTMWADKHYDNTHISNDELRYYLEIFKSMVDND